MNLITALHTIVSQLPVRHQMHGGAPTSDSQLVAISKPRGGHSLQQRLFLKATRGSGEPPVQSMTDGDALVLYDGVEENWVRAEPGSFVEWGADQ